MRQRYYKTHKNILLQVSNHALKDMYMLNYGILKPNELKEAEKPLVKANQFEFHLTDLSDNNSKFRDLNVKLDEEGILPCEGRLKFALENTRSRN